MMVQPDYEDMLKSLNRSNVRYCIVGSFALAYYATPRYTKDMDILVEPTLENGERIIAALARIFHRFSAASAYLTSSQELCLAADFDVC